MTRPDALSDVTETIRTNYMGIASFTMLMWDHIVTFDDEVTFRSDEQHIITDCTKIEYVWKGRQGPIVFLFIINRYLTPLGFIINLFAYFSPVWTPETCKQFVRYEGWTVAIAVEIVGIMMLLRINAIYASNRYRKHIVTLLAFLLVGETVVNAWLISNAEPVPHHPNTGMHACTMIFSPNVGSAAAASAWIPLLYDCIILALTLYRTIPAVRQHRAGYVLTQLLEDGLMYFSVIFSVNIVLTIMIIVAPPGIKNITAQLEQLITVAMMSRITLRLKKTGKLQYAEGHTMSMIVFRVSAPSPSPPPKLDASIMHIELPSRNIDDEDLEASCPGKLQRPAMVSRQQSNGARRQQVYD